MKTKHCAPCGKDKPATNEFFYSNRAKADGFATECKECHKAAAKKRYQADPERWNQQRLPYWKCRYRRQKAGREAAKTPDCLLDLIDTELAYIAALIDGEGSFGILRAKSAARYVPVMRLSMNSEETISWLANKLGVSYQTVKRNSPKHQTSYVTHIGGKRLIHLVSRTLPFFITKRGQAHAIMRFGRTYIPQRGNGQRHPEGIFVVRAAIKTEIHHLNRPHIYGPLPPETLAVLATLDQLVGTSASSSDGH